MNKSILALLFLLVTLILTCVYEKTYSIYSADAPKELILVERNDTPQSKSTAETAAVKKKEEKTSTLPVVSVPTPTKPVEVKPVLEKKPVVKTEKTVEREAKVDASPVTKKSAPAPKVPVVTTKETNAPKPVVIEKTEPVTQTAGEKEIVDYIMWALKNRDIALKNRDEVEARIQELVTKAFEDRQIVLDERSKNEAALAKSQTELIDARDASYESVINPKTTNQGEK